MIMLTAPTLEDLEWTLEYLVIFSDVLCSSPFQLAEKSLNIYLGNKIDNLKY